MTKSLLGLDSFLNLFEEKKPKLDELQAKKDACNLALIKVCSVNF